MGIIETISCLPILGEMACIPQLWNEVIKRSLASLNIVNSSIGKVLQMASINLDFNF
jgi:hypothetical protein